MKTLRFDIQLYKSFCKTKFIQSVNLNNYRRLPNGRNILFLLNDSLTPNDV